MQCNSRNFHLPLKWHLLPSHSSGPVCPLLWDSPSPLHHPLGCPRLFQGWAWRREERYGVEKFSADKYYRKLLAFGSKAEVTLLHTAPATWQKPFWLVMALFWLADGWANWVLKFQNMTCALGSWWSFFSLGALFGFLKTSSYAHTVHVPGDLLPVVFLIWGTMFIFSVWLFLHPWDIQCTPSASSKRVISALQGSPLYRMLDSPTQIFLWAWILWNPQGTPPDSLLVMANTTVSFNCTSRAIGHSLVLPV